MAKLSNRDKEIIRRAPAGSAGRLAALFNISPAYVKKIRHGSRGLRGQNGLGMRPWLLRARDLLEKWRATQHERIEGAYRRALECIDKDEAVRITLEPIGRDEALSLVPGKPGSLALFKGALARKPRRVKKTETAEKTVS
jgi:hypothetical protein